MVSPDLHEKYFVRGNWLAKTYAKIFVKKKLVSLALREKYFETKNSLAWLIPKIFFPLKLKTERAEKNFLEIFSEKVLPPQQLFERVTVGDGSDGFLHTAATLIKTVTTVTNRHGLCGIQACVHRDRGSYCKLFRTR